MGQMPHGSGTNPWAHPSSPDMTTQRTEDWTDAEVAAASSWASSLPGHSDDPYATGPYAGQTSNPYQQYNPYSVRVDPTNPYVQYGPYATPRDTPGSATAGLILGIASFLVCPFVLSIPGLILSWSGYVQAQREPERYSGSGVAVAGLIVNALNLIGSLAVIGFYVFVVFSVAGF